MENQTQIEIQAILTWLNSFQGISKKSEKMEPKELLDGVMLLEVLTQMDNVIWPKEMIEYDEANFCKANFTLITQGFNKYYKKLGCQQLDCFVRQDFINPQASKFQQPQEMIKILQLIVGVAISCENKEIFINAILQNLDDDIQKVLMAVVLTVQQKYSISLSEEFKTFSESSICIDDMLAQIKNLENDKAKYLKHISVLESEKESLKRNYEFVLKEKEELKSRIELGDNVKRLLKKFKSLDELYNEYGDIEEKLERVQKLEAENQMVKKQLSEYTVNFERKKKEHLEEKRLLNEELDIQKEKILQLQRAEFQLESLKKKCENLQDSSNKVSELQNTIRQLDEQKYELELQISQKKNIDEAIQYLKEENLKEKNKVTSLEIQLENQKNEVQDCISQIKVLKRKDELNQQKVNELQLEIDEFRVNNQDSKASFISTNSLQQYITSDLEEQLNKLRSENELLKLSSSNTISAKLLEYENKYEEEKRQVSTLKAQLEISQTRCKKLENQCDELRLGIEDNKHKEGGNTKTLENQMRNLREDRDTAIEKIAQLNNKLQEIEVLKNSNATLNKVRDEQVVEIKKLYQDQNALKDEISKLKEELNYKKIEFNMKEQYNQKEKSILESQLQQYKEQISSNSVGQGSEQYKMQIEKERLNYQNEIMTLQVKLGKQKEEFRNKEGEYVQQIDENNRNYIENMKELQRKYEKEKLDLTRQIQDLNEEVETEKQIREEQENASQRQDELVASLIFNLGIEIQQWKQQALNHGNKPQSSNNILSLNQQMQNSQNYDTLQQKQKINFPYKY